MPDVNLLDELLRQDRALISAELRPATGSFFQPTGFPDIGACIYIDGAGQRRCLVESEQSMANRLEAVCMRPPGVWREPFDGKLPVIRVEGRNGLLATNLTEPHRIASSYVLEGTVNGTTLGEKLEKHLGLKGKVWPLGGREKLTQAVFALDPAAVLHGFQFMQWEAVGLRAARLLHSRLEAVLADTDSDVHYGLVKVDSIEPESSAAKKSNKGQSIAAKTRHVPESIHATFEIDVLTLRERSLVAADDDENRNAQRFLLALALWKIHRFLTNGPAFDARTGDTMGALRLRADCSLAVSKVKWSGSKRGVAFDQGRELDTERLVKPSKEDEAPGLLVAPPSFEQLLKADPFNLGLDTTVSYGK